MKRIVAVFLGLCALGLSFVRPTSAATVYYQPTPYPVTVDTARHHIWDGWITNFYYGKKFIQENQLQIGGWGDTYRTYIKFDVNGLPQNVSQAVLWLMPYPRGDNSTPTVVNFRLVTGDWNTTMTWGIQPTATYLGWRAAPTANQWWGTIITPWYSGWKTNPSANYGLRLDPQSTANNFDVFRSSRYSTPGVSDWARPILQLDFVSPVPIPDFKMPLPGGLSWLETIEPGGYDCKGNDDPYHRGNDYFSIDFDDLTKETGLYNGGANVPVLAAAGGTVVRVNGTDPVAGGAGYYVVIDHDYDNNINTGFTTRYYHLKNPPARQNGASLIVGDSVSQGDQIGAIGNTGFPGMGTHLHFGVRYNNSGAVTQPELAYVVMDGRLLKSYQSECVNGNWSRYWYSGNRTY